MILLLACSTARMSPVGPADETGADETRAGAADDASGPPPARSEVFRQEAAEQLDLLLVIDDSHSMAPHQDLMRSGFASLVGPLDEAGVDYRIGVTTTDVSSGMGAIGGVVLTPTSEDPQTTFAAMVEVGTAGSGTEMGLEAGRLAVETDASGFFRQDADLSVMVLSDEEDSSPLSVNEYLTRYRGFRLGARDAVHIAAATIFRRETCSLQTDEGTPGYRYILAAGASDGASIDLCSATFETDLARLSRNASRVQEAFVLSEEPDAASIHVYVDGAAIPCGGETWSFADVDVRGVAQPAIVFAGAAVPPSGSTIAVYYDLGTGEPAPCPEDAEAELPPVEVGACAYDADCGRGEGCVGGACVAVECLRSETCDFGSVCGPEHTCVPGCESAVDCGAGERCDAGACASATCDNTLEDCALGERCLESTCVVPTGEWCTPCDVEAEDACGGAATCFRWEWDEPGAAWCLPVCKLSNPDSCPVGFTCAEMEGGEFCLANCADLATYL